MAPTTRILKSTREWTKTDHDALIALYQAHGGSAPGDLPGLLDWSLCTGTELVTIAMEGPGVFEAAILLTCHRVAGIHRIRLAGHNWADQQIVPTRTPEAATHLAIAVSTWLAGLGRWRLDLEQLPVHDPFVEALIALGLNTRLAPSDPLPYLIWPTTRTPTNWAPKKFRQQSRQAHRHLTEQHGETEICKLDTTNDILAHLPEYHDVFDARERELGRPSALRAPGIAATKVKVLQRLGNQQRLQAWELRVRGELIAYYITIQVGTTRRMWDGRMAPGLAHVSPGTILMAQVLQEWQRDPRITRVDFMRGSNEFKHRLSTGEINTQRLRAWSSPRLATIEIALTKFDHHNRRIVRAARDRSPALAKIIRQLR
ncbi:MAG: GNAT family N-acetyltransferase [Actinomycetota bacterium]|nr:GNAT family N-acetyltransferase [Actinomycetota bacterium]